MAYNDSVSAKEIWMKCGTKQKPRFTAIHAITLPENIRKNMLQFHALTGCDSTSQFTGIGKRSAWGIFCNNNNSELLYELGGDHTLNTPAMARVEEFVCRLYKPGTSITSIQALRSVMFRTSKKALESLPPTHDSFMLHIRRANHQAFIWRNAHVGQVDLPDPLINGWKEDHGELIPILMNQEPVPANYLQLTTCGCTPLGLHCRTRQCACIKAGLQCTYACACTQSTSSLESWCKNPLNEPEED